MVRAKRPKRLRRARVTSDAVYTSDQLKQFETQFSRVYLGVIPTLFTEDGAFLSFMCTLTATEALAGFYRPLSPTNRERFEDFVADYFPAPYPAQASDLWEFRNAIVHAFSPGPYGLTHNDSRAHFMKVEGRTTLNAQDFFEALQSVSRRYFDDVAKDPDLQKNFAIHANDPRIGIMVVVVRQLAGTT